MTSDRRRHIRVAGPFDGLRLGVFEMPLQIYDLSEGGCFINSFDAPEPGRRFPLKISLTGEEPFVLQAETLYARTGFGFAVKFVDVEDAVLDRLRLALAKLLT